MVKPQKFKAKVISKQQLTSTVYTVSFSLIEPSLIQFEAGQRGLFNVGVKLNNYSLCSLPSESNRIRICVDTSPKGPGSQWIMNLKENDEISCMAPLGKFILNKTNAPKMFLATGTGVSPFHSMIGSLLESGFKDPVYLYFGERFEKDIFWEDVFKKWETQHENFHYCITLTQPSGEWRGKKGYVQDVMMGDLSKKQTLFKSAEFYICGNGNMIETSYSLLLSKGISKEVIFTESFYGPKLN